MRRLNATNMAERSHEGAPDVAGRVPSSLQIYPLRDQVRVGSRRPHASEQHGFQLMKCSVGFGNIERAPARRMIVRV